MAALDYLLQLPSSFVRSNSQFRAHQPSHFPCHVFKLWGQLRYFIVLQRMQKQEEIAVSLLACLTEYFRHIKQLVGTCFNAVVYNLPCNSDALYISKFSSKFVCQLKNVPRSFTLSWIASSATGRITFTFYLAHAS